MERLGAEAASRIRAWEKSDDADELSLSSLDLDSVPQQIYNQPESTKQLAELYLDYNNLTELPADLCLQCRNLETLSLVGNQLLELPNAVSELVSLQQLFVNENQLTALPESFAKLNKLSELNIVGNALTELPENFGGLVNLKELNADENKLVTLVDSFANLVNLEILELENNVLDSLPDNFGGLASLQVLNLSGNKLTRLPDSFADLPNVEFLVMSQNALYKLPDRFESHRTVRNLYLDENSLVALPEWIGDLPQCEILDIKDNELAGEQFAASFADNNKKLKVFEIGGNFIRALPENLGELPLLEKFHMGSIIPEVDRKAFLNGNWIKEVPESFSELVNLKHVHFDENELRKLPEHFGNLIHLVTFDLYQNCVDYLPESFGNLQSLQECYLSQNSLVSLPESFGRLHNLRILRLDRNMLTELPNSMKELVNLTTLDLFQNLLTEIPPWIEKLTKLNCFNLDHNKLEIHYLDYPMLVTSVQYPPRDPALKDNWRGRRQARQVPFETLTEVPSTEPREDFYPDMRDDPTAKFNSLALRDAVRSNMSLWRSHTSAETKRTALKRVGNHWVRDDSSRRDNEDISEVDELWEPEVAVVVEDKKDIEPVVEFPPLPPQRQSEPWVDIVVPSTEDWDAEIAANEANQPPLTITPPPSPPRTIEYRYEDDFPRQTNIHHFVPGEANPTDIEFVRAVFETMEGQFDDVDDESEAQI